MEDEFNDDFLFEREFDNTYLEDFRRALWGITDEKELLNMLPNPRYHGYIELLSYLKRYAEEESSCILEELEVAKDLEDIEYLKKDLELSRKRIMLFSYRIEEKKLEEQKQEECDRISGGRRLLYLKSKAGNSLVEADMEDVPFEGLGDMYEAFSFLKSGEFSSDQTKYKILSNNRNLKGIREVKVYQSRIYFYHLEKDIELVFLALVKKSDTPKRELEKLVIRAQAMYDSLGAIRKSLSDPVKALELLNEGSEITSRIDDKLSPQKVGVK